MKAAILTDLTKCVGCEACVMACKEINNLPKNVSPNKLSAYTFTAIDKKQKLNVRRQCMHCEHPACVSACPVGALKKTEKGAVVYDAGLCMGCRYCITACPFSILTYEWDKALPKVKKCILCYDTALAKGQAPACTSACPTGATIFGDRDDLIKEAKSRIANNPDRYIDHIYGAKEAGGTSVLYLSSMPFADLGFPTAITDEAYPELTWKVLSTIPNIISTASVTLFGLWWIINRRIKLQDNDEH